MKTVIIILALCMPFQETFKQKQLKFIRVKDAYSEKENTVKNYFLNKNLNYQGFHIFIRAFKKERTLEVWVRQSGKTTYDLLRAYDFCAVSGNPGPKRREGDGQIPEGFYHINHFNPQSNFHLSLGINYPNQSDKLLGNKSAPGSAIYIHGSCVTIGCIPITDDKIKELYILGVEARNNGQANIPVHIYPARMSTENISALKTEYTADAELEKFWNNLQGIYQKFETDKTVAPLKVNSKGEYHF
jgi:murein L,D-transpeptidase YafK